MKRAYAEIAEGQMHYRHAGEGRKHVLLLHMSGSSSDEFEGVGDLLAERGYNAYAVDLLAYGASDPSPRFYSLEDHARTLVGFLDAIGLDSAFVYGNLATANLAVHMGVKYRERVNGMMLAHPLYSPDPANYTRKRNWPEFSLIEPKADGSHLMEMWSRVAKYGAPAKIADSRCACMHQAGEWAETLHWALFEDKPIGELLPEIAVPSVVVAYSTFGEPDLLKQAAAMISGAKFDIYEGGTPYIARQAPERVAEMFAKYF